MHLSRIMDWHSEIDMRHGGSTSPHRLSDAYLTGQAVDPKAEKKKITRTRISYSCHQCRKRKIKCDKVHPICTNCTKAAETCTYDVAIPPEPTPSNVKASESRQGTKRRRDPVTPAKSVSTDSPSANEYDALSSTQGSASVESRIDRLSALVQAVRQEQSTKEAFEAESARFPDLPNGKHNSLPNGQNSRHNLDPDNLKINALSLGEKERARIAGAPFFAYVAEELGELNQLLRQQNKYVSATSITNSACQKQNLSNPNQEDDDQSDLASDPGIENNGFHGEGIQDYAPVAESLGDCPSCRSLITDKMIFHRNQSARDSSIRESDMVHLLHVPTKSQSHALFRCWYSGVHGSIPVVYPPIALEKYTQFWDWYEHREASNISIPDLSFMPLLYAIWYSGSVACPVGILRAQFNVTRAALSSQLHDHVIKWLVALDFPRKASLSTLGAYLIINSVLSKEEEPLVHSTHVSLGIRIAQTMGLHRDPGLFGLPTWEAELRRRMWWHILHTDLVSAIACGLPPMIADEQFWDVRLISELKDNYHRMPEGEAYERDVKQGLRLPDVPDDPASRSSHSMVDIHHIVLKAKYWYGVQIRKVLKVQLGVAMITREMMQTMRQTVCDLEDYLEEAIKRIPTKGIPEMGFLPESDQSESAIRMRYDEDIILAPSFEDLAPFMGPIPENIRQTSTAGYHWTALTSYHRWSRVMLSLHADKAHCLSYAPFLKQSHSRLWNTSRQCALHHAQGFMRKFISLATDPVFEPFRWRWPGCHQPMHAAIILLIDLYARPHSAEAPSSRAFIDRVWELATPEMGLVRGENAPSATRPFREGGFEAWEMLRRLRQQAWRKAGLDPQFFWTEERQIAAGIMKPRNEQERIMQTLRDGGVSSPNEPGGDPSDTLARAEKISQGIEIMVGLRNGDTNGDNSSDATKKRRVSPLTTTTGQRNGVDATQTMNMPPWPTSPNPHDEHNHANVTKASDTSPSSDGPSPFETSPSSHDTKDTEVSSPLNQNQRLPKSKPEDTFSDPMETMDAVFDWEAWDAVFGQQPNIDEEEAFLQAL